MKALFKAFMVVVMMITIPSMVFACKKTAKAEETAATAVENGKIVAVEAEDVVEDEGGTVEGTEVKDGEIDLDEFFNTLNYDDREAFYILSEEDQRLWASDPEKYNDRFRQIYKNHMAEKAEDPNYVISKSYFWLSYDELNTKTYFADMIESGNGDSLAITISREIGDLMIENAFINKKGGEDFCANASIEEYGNLRELPSQGELNAMELLQNDSQIYVSIERYHNKVEIYFAAIVVANPYSKNKALIVDASKWEDQQTPGDDTYYLSSITLKIESDPKATKPYYSLYEETQNGRDGTRIIKDIFATIDARVINYLTNIRSWDIKENK